MIWDSKVTCGFNLLYFSSALIIQASLLNPAYTNLTFAGSGVEGGTFVDTGAVVPIPIEDSVGVSAQPEKRQQASRR